MLQSNTQSRSSWTWQVLQPETSDCPVSDLRRTRDTETQRNEEAAAFCRFHFLRQAETGKDAQLQTKHPFDFRLESTGWNNNTLLFLFHIEAQSEALTSKHPNTSFVIGVTTSNYSTHAKCDIFSCSELIWKLNLFLFITKIWLINCKKLWWCFSFLQNY